MNKRLKRYMILAAATTLAIHVANKIISASAELLDKLDQTSRKHIYKWRFGDIFYTKRGSGSPILLIHDLIPGSSGYEWSRVEEQMAKGHTVYVIDLPGCGRSDKPALTYTNFMYVQMLTDFIQNVIKEKADVITSGFSGSLAVMTTLYNKEVIHSITMVNPTDPSILSKAPGQKERIIRKIIELPIFGTLIYNIAVCKANIDNDFTEKYYYNPFHIDGDMMDAFYEAAHKGGSKGKYLYASMAGRYVSINILPALYKLDIPLKIMFGSAEPNVDKTGEKYKEMLQNVDICVIERTKHFPHIENPNEFMKSI